MLRPEFMSASDTTGQQFSLAVSTATDESPLESDSWPEKWRTPKDVAAVRKVLDSDMRESLRSACVKRPQPPDTKPQHSTASRYEALISIAVAIGARHGDRRTVLGPLSRTAARGQLRLHWAVKLRR